MNYYYYYPYSLIRAFHISVSRLVFHWRLSDSKSPQVSMTLLSILAVLNNAVVWMVSTCPTTSKSSSPFSNPIVTVPNAPITIGIIVTCMFHSFFNSLARSRYLYLLFTFFQFYSVVSRDSKVDYFASSLFLLIKHVGHLKLGSKPAQLYVRLIIIIIMLGLMKDCNKPKIKLKIMLK